MMKVRYRTYPPAKAPNLKKCADCDAMIPIRKVRCAPCSDEHANRGRHKAIMERRARLRQGGEGNVL